MRMCVYCQKYEMASDTPPDVNTYYKPHDKKANDKQSVWHYFLIEMPSKKLKSVNNVPKQYIGAYTEPAHKNPDKIRTSRFGVKKVAKNPDFPKWNGYANTTCQVHVSRNPCYCCFCILASLCKTVFLGHYLWRQEAKVAQGRRCCLVSVAQYRYCGGRQTSTIWDDVGLTCMHPAEQLDQAAMLHQDWSAAIAAGNGLKSSAVGCITDWKRWQRSRNMDDVSAVDDACRWSIRSLVMSEWCWREPGHQTEEWKLKSSGKLQLYRNNFVAKNLY